MTATRPLLQGHDLLIHKMRCLGYNTSKKGTCFGVACMAAEAILANNLKNFTDTINLILNSDIRLRQHENFISEIRPVLDGIQLYQKADIELSNNLHQEYKKFIEVISNITSPKSLHYQGKIKNVRTEYGIYSPAELEAHFASLRQVIQKYTPNAPIALILKSANHAICVSFDTDNQMWTLIDANTLPAMQIATDIELASRIHNAFGYLHTAPHLIMDTQILTLGDYKHKTMHMIRHWHKTPTYHFANHIHPLKPFLLDTLFNTNLLFKAALERNTNQVAQLISLGASVNTMDQFDGITPLHTAVLNKQLSMVRLLLQHGANPNTQFQENNKHHGETPLYVAASNGNADIVKELIMHGANLFFARTKDARTPLTTARIHGHKKVVEILQNALKKARFHPPYLYGGLFAYTNKYLPQPVLSHTHKQRTLVRGKPT